MSFGQDLRRQGADVADMLLGLRHTIGLPYGKVWAPGLAQRRQQKEQTHLFVSQFPNMFQ